MKKLTLISVLFTTCFSVLISQTEMNEACSPVPFLNAEYINEDEVLLTWDYPEDTTNLKRYRLAYLEAAFNPCLGDTTFIGGTITPFGTSSPNVLSRIHTLHYNVSGYVIRAEYDTCNSEFTESDYLYNYDSTWYDQNFHLTVVVTLEDGGNPEGGNIHIEGSNCYYDYQIFELQTDSTGISLIDSIMHGLYHITVSKTGYHTATVDSLYLNQDTTVYVELKVYHVGVNEKTGIGLAKVYPNPFSTSTTIEYELIQPQTVTITFYNQFGKQVERIEQKQSVGKQQVVWTPNLPGGVYYFRLQAGDQTASGKLVLVR